MKLGGTHLGGVISNEERMVGIAVIKIIVSRIGILRGRISSRLYTERDCPSNPEGGVMARYKSMRG